MWLNKEPHSLYIATILLFESLHYPFVASSAFSYSSTDSSAPYTCFRYRGGIELISSIYVKNTLPPPPPPTSVSSFDGISYMICFVSMKMNGISWNLFLNSGQWCWGGGWLRIRIRYGWSLFCIVVSLWESAEYEVFLEITVFVQGQTVFEYTRTHTYIYDRIPYATIFSSFRTKVCWGFPFCQI